MFEWCLSHQRDVIMALDPVAAKDHRLLLWENGLLSVYYAPVDWVNTAAKVMLVGITPGASQAAEFLRSAQACLRTGCSAEETLRRADAAGSFSGPMRKNLVTMLDGIGLAGALGVDSTARLFNPSPSGCPLLGHRLPGVRQRGTIAVGARPLARHPVLRSLVRACLGARIAMAPDALIIPLGTAAQEAVSLLTADGLVNPGRCLPGFRIPPG